MRSKHLSKQENEKEVLEAILKGAVTLRKIEKVTGLHVYVVRYFVEKLEDKGLITVKRKKNLWIIIPTAKAYRYLEILQAQTVKNFAFVLSLEKEVSYLLSENVKLLGDFKGLGKVEAKVYLVEDREPIRDKIAWLLIK